MVSAIGHRLQIRVVLVLVVLGLVALGPMLPSADQAQHVYDELGRLVGVVDGTGTVAVYNYDAVGNLLAIERFTPAGTGIGIFLLAPTRALVGATVQMHGFGFDPTPGNNQVTFNGTAATVVSATSTTLIATVPSGATSGTVTVTNANGTATGPQPFTVLVPPIVTGLTPSRAAQGTTSQLVIAGFNLADATAVTFTQSGLSATVLAGATATTLPITVSVGAAVPAGSYPFSVVSPAGTAQSGTVTVTVTTPVPSLSLNTDSVFLPFPAQTPPSGSSMSVAPPVSVSMP